MVKIGLESCAYFGLYDYDTGFAKLKEHGYDCIDYAERLWIQRLSDYGSSDYG